MNKSFKVHYTLSLLCLLAFLFFPASIVEASDYYTVNGTTITVNVSNGTDITKALDAALLKAKELGASGTIYTVQVPAGNYTTSGILHIYSNTTLSMYDVTLSCNPNAGNFNMLINGTTSYNNSAACSGYNGFQNITLAGGTYQSNSSNSKSQIRLFHATNVTIKDITITGGNSDHQLEVCAINNFTVTNSSFKNMTPSTKAAKREAIQLDLANHSSIYPDIVLDGTMMKNVSITGCTFSNVSRGIGSHSLLLGAYLENIVISDNIFNNVEQECIVALNYYNATITGNSIQDCGAGILFQYAKGTSYTMFTTIKDGAKKYNGTVRHDAASIISNNIIQTKYNKYCDENQGIKLYGRKLTSKETNSVDGGTIPADDYYVSGVTVSNNTITTSGYGISLMDAKNCTIINNTILGDNYSSNDPIAKQKKYNGIHIVNKSTGNVFKNNSISSVQQNGIFMQDSSSAKEISGHTINHCGKNGIHLYNKAKVISSISGNTISNVTTNAISLDNNSSVSSIENNNISNAKKTGIYVLNNATVKKSITRNTITSCNENSICINQNAKVLSAIHDNVISSAKKYGIYILNKSSVSGEIKDNRISKCNIPIVVNTDCKGLIGINKISKNSTNKYKIQGFGGTTTKSLKSPKQKNASKKGKSINTSWTKVSNANGYIVEVSTDKKFSKPKKATSSKLKTTVKGLKKGKTYYVRVRAYKKINKNYIYGKYSNIRTLKL